MVSWCKWNFCGSCTADMQWILTSVLSHSICTEPKVPPTAYHHGAKPQWKLLLNNTCRIYRSDSGAQRHLAYEWGQLDSTQLYSPFTSHSGDRGLSCYWRMSGNTSFHKLMHYGNWCSILCNMVQIQFKSKLSEFKLLLGNHPSCP